MKVRRHIVLTPSAIQLDGKNIEVRERGLAMLKAVYQDCIGGYPKFYKMDILSKLGFVASELLLHQEDDCQSVSLDERQDVQGLDNGHEDRAVVIFGKSGSSYSDACFQHTIDRQGDYYPSPAAFVYTLPNILTGEIAIRHHYYGETCYMALPEKDTELMMRMAEQTLMDDATTSVVCGWLDATDENHFEGELWLIEQGC